MRSVVAVPRQVRAQVAASHERLAARVAHVIALVAMDAHVIAARALRRERLIAVLARKHLAILVVTSRVTLQLLLAAERHVTHRTPEQVRIHRMLRATMHVERHARLEQVPALLARKARLTVTQNVRVEVILTHETLATNRTLVVAFIGVVLLMQCLVPFRLKGLRTEATLEYRLETVALAFVRYQATDGRECFVAHITHRRRLAVRLINMPYQLAISIKRVFAQQTREAVCLMHCGVLRQVDAIASRSQSSAVIRSATSRCVGQVCKMSRIPTVSRSIGIALIRKESYKRDSIVLTALPGAITRNSQ